MTTRLAALLFAAAGCQEPAPEMRWLHGLDGVVASAVAPRAPADELADDCGAGASRRIELVADVAPSAGRETIVASYSGGIAVFDREDQLVAETPGYRCVGSADELDAIAVGDAYGDRVLAIAATSGGRREAATWIGLFRTGATLEPTFTARVETRTDDKVERGAIYMFPGGLLYQRPGGPLRLWQLDPGSRIYIPVLRDEPHDEPPRISLR